ncbi:MAG: acyl-CoA thioesterase [Saprospirales bacterium]|nr:MAG: acyl-CoA thioesterase [Saprospirales bacterium]
MERHLKEGTIIIKPFAELDFCLDKLTKMEEKKILRTKRYIRFSDCDPMGHLFNLNYLHYFLEAREDQVRDYYNLDMALLASKYQWVLLAGTHQISYLNPAMMNEEVEIISAIIDHSEKWILVEFQMLDMSEKPKAFMWSKFVSFSLATQSTAPIPEEMKQYVNKFSIEKPASDYDTRFNQLRHK